MHVYYYKAIAPCEAFHVPGHGLIHRLSTGDVIEVGEVAHNFIMASPFAEKLLLVGQTFLGILSANEEAEPAEEAEEVEPTEEAEEVEQAKEAEEAVDLGMMAAVFGEEVAPTLGSPSRPKLPPEGSHHSRVFKYLEDLEAAGYIQADLDAVRERFNSPKVLQELQRLEQKL